jgi:hypothetical protein
MGCHDAEAGLEYVHRGGHEFEQGQGVFAARDGHKDTVAFGDKFILGRCLVELVAEAVHELLFFGALGHGVVLWVLVLSVMPAGELGYYVQKYIKKYKNYKMSPILYRYTNKND